MNTVKALLCCVYLCGYTLQAQEQKVEDTNILQTIQGSVRIEGVTQPGWAARTKVVVDGGLFYGFLKENGEFEIHNMPPGTYLIEVVSPNNVFEPARVDVSGKSGKIRARKVDLLKMSNITTIPYPLKFKSEKPAQFFEIRESWSIIETLKNPSVLFLVLPLGLFFLLPRLMKNIDPEQQKEVEGMFGGQQGSSIEEMITNFLGGGSTQQKSKVVKKPKH